MEDLGSGSVLVTLGKVSDSETQVNLGMINAPLCAEALATMLLGKDLPADFPKSYLVTEERIQKADL